jgi:hypothetical protein
MIEERGFCGFPQSLHNITGTATNNVTGQLPNSLFTIIPSLAVV